MKRLMLAFAFLLGIAADAGAAGGWILWQDSPLATSSDDQWHQMDGYESLAECRAAAGIERKRFEAKPQAYRHTYMFDYACFPSDFDPRGKK